MATITKQDFIKGMNALVINYGDDMKMTEDKIELWWKRFKFLTPRDFFRMIENTMENVKYPPNMAVLLEQRDESANMKSVMEMFPEDYEKKERGQENENS